MNTFVTKVLRCIVFCMVFVPYGWAKSTDLTVGMRLEPPHLDPTQSASASIDFIVYNNIFEGLTTLDKNGVVRPLLAQKWHVSADAKTYIFTLKQGVQFHDKTAFDADDVVFTIARMIAPDTLNSRKGLYTNIAHVQKLSPYQVSVRLKTADGNFLYKMALPDAVIVAPETAGMNTSHPKGTGPFVFKKFDKGDSVYIRKNPDYHGVPAKLETVRFRFVADASSATIGLASGQIDAYPYFVDPIHVTALTNNPKLSVVYGSTEGETMVAINNRTVSDIHIRRALHHAIDKHGMIALTAPGAHPIGSHMPPHSPYYVDLSNAYPYDVNMAQSLRKQSPLANKELQFYVPPAYGLIAAGVVDYLRKSGFKVKMHTVDWATWLSKVFKQGQYDITVITHVEPMDYDVYANPKYYYGYDSDSYRDMMQRLSVATTESERTAILHNAQRHLSHDAVNVWLYQRPKVGVWHKSVKGMWHNAPVEGIVLRDVYWQ